MESQFIHNNLNWDHGAPLYALIATIESFLKLKKKKKDELITSSAVKLKRSALSNSEVRM